jgi:hypothetical protein
VSDEIGTWTITVRGGPAFWANAAMTMQAVVYDRVDGPSRDAMQRLVNARAEYEPPIDVARTIEGR